MILYLMNEIVNVKERISKALKLVGELVYIWDARSLLIYAKLSLYYAIPLNIVLWVVENWSNNQEDLHWSEAFYHCSLRCILGIRFKRVINEHTKNVWVRRRCHDFENITNIVKRRQLKSFGCIMRMTNNKLPFFFCSRLSLRKGAKAGHAAHQNTLCENLAKLFPEMPKNRDSI